MEAKILGCEKQCIMYRGQKPSTCSLPKKYQKACEGRVQYQAGLKEAVEWLSKNLYDKYIPSPSSAFAGSDVKCIAEEIWEAKLKEWGIK
jgi:hypothetical protein